MNSRTPALFTEPGQDRVDEVTAGSVADFPKVILACSTERDIIPPATTDRFVPDPPSRGALPDLPLR